MKLMNLILLVLMLQVLIWYGYTYSLTTGSFFVQGWIGTVLPCIIALMAWLHGYTTGVDHGSDSES